MIIIFFLTNRAKSRNIIELQRKQIEGNRQTERVFF